MTTEDGTKDMDAVPVDLGLRVPFQLEMVKEIHRQDGLMIAARGLGLLQMVSALLHAYDRPGKLVILMGADQRENEWIGEAMAMMAENGGGTGARGLRVINNESMTVEKREPLYRQGGIFSVTSRILVVDLLTRVLPEEVCTGMVVLHAEHVTVSSMEAWALRIWQRRRQQQTAGNGGLGFIKAFSETPEPFVTGFNPLANRARNLFVQNVYLWPRFHLRVSASIDAGAARNGNEIMELDVSMTERMRDIQTCLVECAELTIKEIKRLNSKFVDLDDEDWNVDTALHRQFDVIIQRKLDKVWHGVSYKTRQLCRDLTVLRSLFTYLPSYDCVDFLRVVETIIAANDGNEAGAGGRINQSPWVLLDAAQRIFQLARDRVYRASRQPNALPEPVLEQLPKCEMLGEVMQEIELNLQLHPPHPEQHSTKATLVMCSDERTARQIREYLQSCTISSSNNDGESTGHPAFLEEKFRDFIVWRAALLKMRKTHFGAGSSAAGIGSRDASPGPTRPNAAPPSKRRRVRGAAAAATTPRPSRPIITFQDELRSFEEMTQQLRPSDDAEEYSAHEGASLRHDECSIDVFDPDELVIVLPYDGDMDSRALEEIRPHCIIMYDPDASFVRRVEVYRAAHEDADLRLYFMYYGGSMEEQQYLSSIRREKDAFTRLIREKAELPLMLASTAETTGVQEDAAEERFFHTLNTRIAGGGRLRGASAEQPRVVTDIREIRTGSSLPVFLDGLGMLVVPCQLIVGDYIISPEMCIERKSVKDLVQSLNSGRLYSQCEMMCAHYAIPILLIEFSARESFALEPFLNTSGSIGQNDLQTKLTMLILAFPHLRVVWSSSPAESAQIIEDLKKGEDEPDVAKAAAAGVAPNQRVAGTMNEASVNLLKAMPMMTSRNFRNVVYDDNVKTVRDFANASQADLVALVGPEAGNALYGFFNLDARK